ncbi:MAG: CSLREA domain-containing protein, partial [Chloroflexi bacterium]|nr:CSLREA domain-containing protein [Chloroflexota bacterium]
MRNMRFVLLLAALAAGIGFRFQPAIASETAAFTVTKTGDTQDGLCAASDCSLREAVRAANASPGADTITLPAGTYLLTITGQGENAAASGDLDITEDVTITGAGAGSTIVDGAALLDRGFHVLAGVSASLSGLTIQNGAAPGGDNLGGGGILSEGTLTLSNLTVKDSSAQRGGGLRNSLGVASATGCTFQDNEAQDQGGGIYSDGVITVTNSIVSGNSGLRGAGIGSSWDVTLNRVTITNNTATGDGGGIYSDYTLTATDVSLIGNQAEDGGGLYNFYDSALDRATFSGNHASQNGGGIFNRDATMTLTNTTLSGNSAGPYGGGLYNAGSASAAFFNSAIVNNTISGATGDELGGGIYHDFEAFTVRLDHTIVAGNTLNGGLNNCGGNTFMINPTIMSGEHGFNLEAGDGYANSCNFDAIAGDGDLTMLPDALLGPLQNNGGFILTHAPLAGSPAIDGGAATVCAAADARRVVRPVDSDADGAFACDIGAVETVIAGYVGLSATAYTLAEDGGSATITVRRYGGTQAVQVSYYTSPGTARAGYDYATSNGVLSWNAGDTSN